MADNPFKLVYDGIWLLAERNTALMDLVKLGNRIKFDDEVGNKRNVSDADLPELVLLTEGATSNLQASSSHSEIVRRYSWMLSTGSLNVDDYNNIAWEFWRSMIDWDRFICGIQWEYEPGESVDVVQRADFLDAEEGMYMSNEQNRKIRGWAQMWSAEVLMMIPTATVRIPDL